MASTENPSKRQKTELGDEIKDNKCIFINVKKNRRCGLQVRKGQIYCFAHLPKSEGENSDSSSKIEKGKVVTRIKCPIDNSHTIWSNNLNKHLKICNLKKEQDLLIFKQNNYDWFDLDHNVKDLKNEIVSNDINHEEWKKLLDSILIRYDEIIGKDYEIPFDQLQIKDGLEERFDELDNQKHLIQQSSLIGHVSKILDNDFKGTIIEFGCGRAEFTRYFNKYWINTSSEKPTYLLIDRENPRLKFDKKILNEGALDVKRLKVDIKDLVLNKAIESKSCIGISKHLCGVATDLTLRCLETAKLEDSEFKVDGCVIAMCCRHCCNYDVLLTESKDYLQNFGINATNFKYFRKMFAWATNGIKPDQNKEDGKDHFTGLSLGEREIIGLKMRLILDNSRLIAMTKRGWNAKIVKYCSRDVSLENNCLIIKKN